MRYIITVVLLLLASCTTLTQQCRHTVIAQYFAALELYDEVQIIRCDDSKSDNVDHAQIRARNYNEPWLYFDNDWMRYEASSEPRANHKVTHVYDEPQKFINDTIRIKQ
jgi:hypothetical protein